MSGRERPPGDLAPVLILAAVGALVAMLVIVWAGGSVGALVCGAGWHPPELGGQTIATILSDGPPALWPDAPAAGVWAGIGATLAALAGGAGWGGWKAWRLWGWRGGLATTYRMRDMSASRMRTRAMRLRPGLAARAHDDPPVADTDVGIRLGKLAGTPLYAAWEDTVLALMGTRSGKTAAIAAPIVLRAPGPAMVTSIRADVYLLTSADVVNRGTVWGADFQQIAYLPRTFWWDMVATATDFESAHRLAGHFTSTLQADKGADFWVSAARSLLTDLFLAAARSGGLADFLYWLSTPSDPTPVKVLEEVAPALSADLKARSKTAEETREGIYQTAREAVACLLDPRIAAWITPDPQQPDLPQFDPDAFAVSTDTLYLLCKKGSAGAAGVVAALADAVFKAAEHAAERAGGRLDPPLAAVLDEAANVCKISDLPDTLTYCGGMGINVVTIIQNYPQGESAWGRNGMASLWSTANHVLVGAGVNDPKLTEDLSKLIGSHDVPIRSLSYGGSGRSVSVSPQLRRTLPPDKIRSIPKLTAVLLPVGMPAAYIDLVGWWTDPALTHVAAQEAKAKAALTLRAQQARTRS